MVFSGLTFLYLFLPGTLLLCFAMPARLRNAVLLLASLVFYFYGERLCLLLMLAVILLSWGAGLLLERLRGRRRRLTSILFLCLCLGLLGLFKYADLLAGTVNALAGRPLLALLGLPLPIGVSFYSFQAISYGLDVWRGRYPAERSLPRLALYLSFFPQLIAGPIVRYEQLAPALRERHVGPADFGAGALRFCVGLGKKVLLADRLFALCTAAAAAREPSVALAWAESFAYLLYVYFDFSGYSDMAVGLGACFGFRLPENFRYPLVSASIRDFWRRWHITLGAWFRDYLYIPLGGSRRGLGRQLRNLLLVWALTGLWHGASWNYAIWGISVGLLLAGETLLRRRKGPDAAEPGGRRLLRRAAVLLLMILCFVWFRFPDWSGAAVLFGRMFGGAPLWSGESAYLLRGGALLLAVGALGATPLPRRLLGRLEETGAGRCLLPAGRALWMLLLLGLSTAWLVDGSFSPFLYFRF